MFPLVSFIIDDIFSISCSKRLILQIFVSSLIWNQGLKINEIYLNWLTTQGSNSDEVFFSLTFFMNWIDELSLFYKFPS